MTSELEDAAVEVYAGDWSVFVRSAMEVISSIVVRSRLAISAMLLLVYLLYLLYYNYNH